jgi:ABC-2 type transport system ATP-binding protein
MEFAMVFGKNLHFYLCIYILSYCKLFIFFDTMLQKLLHSQSLKKCMQRLAATNLTKTFNGFTAINNLNLSVAAGEIFCLLGQNGAGKTTTINIFLGFVEPTSGTATINGLTVGKQTQPHIAYIPEVVQLYSNLTGIENLQLFSELAGFKYNKPTLQDLLLKADLQTEAHAKILSTYSKGMRQKVGISIALAKKADVIFMDEPTSGLDPKATNEFTKICKDLAAEGKTIFMATHDIFNAVNVGTTIGIMKQGNLIHCLPCKDITASSLQQLYLETI